MYYYRIEKKIYSGESIFVYVQHKKQFTLNEFEDHLYESFVEWVRKQPNRLALVAGKEKNYADHLNEVVPLLEEKFGYQLIKSRCKIRYQAVRDEEVKIGYYIEEDLVKKQPFTLDQIKMNEEASIYMIDEEYGVRHMYPLLHDKKYSKETFFSHLEQARQELVVEREHKPIIGIELAHKLCEKFGYEPITVEATAFFEEEGEEGGNRFGFITNETGAVSFEKDYPYRRDPEEDYLKNGDPAWVDYYFSKNYTKKEKPRLARVQGKWYAFSEYRYGNYRTTIDEKDVKKVMYREEGESSKIEEIIDSFDYRYGEKVKEGMENSIMLEKPIDLSYD
jgi:hypothetical protein